LAQFGCNRNPTKETIQDPSSPLKEIQR